MAKEGLTEKRRRRITCVRSLVERRFEEVTTSF
jgi:hypothetical protein